MPNSGSSSMPIGESNPVQLFNWQVDLQVESYSQSEPYERAVLGLQPGITHTMYDPIVWFDPTASRPSMSLTWRRINSWGVCAASRRRGTDVELAGHESDSTESQIRIQIRYSIFQSWTK